MAARRRLRALQDAIHAGQSDSGNGEFHERTETFVIALCKLHKSIIPRTADFECAIRRAKHHLPEVHRDTLPRSLLARLDRRSAADDGRFIFRPCVFRST